MRCLITGIEGFAGYHLARHLSARGDTVIGTAFGPTSAAIAGYRVVSLDINRSDDVRGAIEDIAPEVIYHLAALSNVKVSWESTRSTLETNFIGAFNVLEAAASLGGNAPRVLLVGSAEQYGPVPPERQPISEDCPLDPRNPYALSKVAQEYLGLNYFRTGRLPVYLVRAFNHSGPGQAPIFVASSFAKQIAEIESDGREPVMFVGNLTSRRDFTDVRDTVRAYATVVEKGDPGEVYNVCTGTPVGISEILNTLLAASSRKIRVEVDPKLYRPTDIPAFSGDRTKISTKCGWRPEIPLRQTLTDLLDYWRHEVRKAGQ